MTNKALDKIDLEIISILQKDGRISNLDLAERINLSPSPCSRRVKQLEQHGVIKGYGAKVNPTAMGQHINVLINVKLHSQTPEDIDDFIKTIEDLPQVTECLLLTGSIDYMLRVQTENVESLKTFVLKKLKTIPSVAETSTKLVLDVVKSSA